MHSDSFGTDLRAWTFDGMRVSETLMPAGLHLDAHAHDAGQICFVLEGTYVERSGGGERLLAPGAMHVRAPGALHANAFGSDVLTLLISIDAWRWTSRRMFDDVARVMQRPELALSDEPEWLADAQSLIARRCAEPLSLSAIAREIGVGRGTLATAFRRFRGTSVGESIRAARVAQAKTLLITQMPLAEIALACGFHDQAHFTRVFRAATGTTPARYRRNAGLLSRRDGAAPLREPLHK
ncbi:MAG TPA: AraC family transcriptional regulator [Thermoanaerobaculia bacterium]|nr:AraC family transcriptional regulator [Thermoanaerobaculia bacterium]